MNCPLLNSSQTEIFIIHTLDNYGVIIDFIICWHTSGVTRILVEGEYLAKNFSTITFENFLKDLYKFRTKIFKHFPKIFLKF